MDSLKLAIRIVAEFTKTTLIGGLLVVVPIYLSLILLLKMLAGAIHIISPVTRSLPESLQLKELVAIIAIIFVCLVCGIALRTRPGMWAKNTLERSLLERIPGYSLIRGVAGRIAGTADEQTFAVVLAEIEDALVPAFLIEECDAENCAIFVPSVPTPAAGAIYIISKKRVHRVDVPFTQAVSVVTKWGAGSRELFLHAQLPPENDSQAKTQGIARQAAG